MTLDQRSRAENLTCWRGPVTAEPLGGGMTNTNFVVRDGAERFVVRIGDDIPVHQVMRFNERAASIAGHAAGRSPEGAPTEAGPLVMRFIGAPRSRPMICAVPRSCPGSSISCAAAIAI